MISKSFEDTAHYNTVNDGQKIKEFTADRYWGKIPECELEKALGIIDTEGWDSFAAKYKDRLDFTTEENRADWRFLVPLDRNSVVLDVGAGLGRTSIPLARVVKKVVACDTSVIRMKFLKKLADSKGLINIEVVVADIFNPPFEQESFDLIVMNGVLEWVGRTDLYKNPREAQIACLKICRGLLKKGGFLYVGIENRFAAAYLRGIDHNGLRFTSYMPRWIANKYTELKKHHKYDTHTYSMAGYKKLFKVGGFDNLDPYLVYPGYNRPRIIIPYNNLRLLKYIVLMSSGGSVLRKIARLFAHFPPIIWLYRAVFFSFNIFARK